MTKVEDDAWSAGSAVSDLERRDRDVDGERIGNEGPQVAPSSHSELRNWSMLDRI